MLCWSLGAGVFLAVNKMVSFGKMAEFERIPLTFILALQVCCFLSFALVFSF